MSTRPRASAANAAFTRALTPPPAHTPTPPEPTPTPRPQPRSQQRSKYTLLLDPDPAADFDELATRLRRHLGRKVDKSEIIRSWIALTADDPALLHDLAQEIQARHNGTTP